MDKALFERLTQSMSQMNEIIEGTREPSRTFHIDAMRIKEIRQASGLSQSKFAELISVNVDTLRNWEQGRRSPDRASQSVTSRHCQRPEKRYTSIALLSNDPANVDC
ncbi:Cro/Cl family transcriptional regulator [Salmonella enterica subsp. arizonae]|uniref:Cro/Cl family transcriptional regulator n=1 Tax=Salmonella enterica subsp. arizonae TaxID=59203 RepID=A0A379T564_SALER|nr:Cro/Cl family transcriptional regulator [Salmonella enterica subsp. arizonae]